MERKRLKHEELEFPEAIIQHIQSLLTGEEAARTTILSKSWHSAWLTRPNLVLNERDFKERRGSRGFSSEFSKYAKKTIKRYEQSNLKIESLKLRMESYADCCGAAADLPNKLIKKALGKLGATRLSLRLDKSFVFPCEVVFGAHNNLVELSVQGCTIKNVIKRGCCSRLKSLSLHRLTTTRDGLSNVISSCPSIEKLSLSNIEVLEKEDHYWSSDDEEEEDWSDDDDEENVEFFPSPTWRSAATVVTSRINNNNFNRLKCLVLCHASYEALFAAGDFLLSEFPFLTDLTLTLNMKNCRREDQIVQILNCSLERITLGLEECYDYGRRWPMVVKLDVPSIRKFTFVGGADIIPSLSFLSPSTREWESHVSIKRYGDLTASWFRKLNEFLAELRQSKIHLSLRVHSTRSFNYKAGDVESNFVGKHELERLTIDMVGLPSFSCYALFDGLFRLCRPKLIALANYPGSRNTNIDFLCKALEQGMFEKVAFPGQIMYGLNDLEEVNAQVFDSEDDVPQWRPIPLSSLRDEDNNVYVPHHRSHGFWLKWKP